ncbi:MAG: TlpA family protein disulfide reductase [Methylophilaceae bacterium]
MLREVKKILIPVVLLSLLGFLVMSLNNRSAPNITYITLQGNKISMSELKGKVVLINFWATNCSSCVNEMPDLVNTYHTYKAKGFEVIAVAMPYDPPAQVLNFASQKELPFPVMHDGFSEVVNSFGGVNVTPTAYIFDKQGKRLQRTTGALDFDKLHALLDKELG